MWLCEKCQSECEDIYEACWNCSAMKPGVPSYADRSQEYLAQLAEGKRQQQVLAHILEAQQEHTRRFGALLTRWEGLTDQVEGVLKRIENRPT